MSIQVIAKKKRFNLTKKDLPLKDPPFPPFFPMLKNNKYQKKKFPFRKPITERIQVRISYKDLIFSKDSFEGERLKLFLRNSGMKCDREGNLLGEISHWEDWEDNESRDMIYEQTVSVPSSSSSSLLKPAYIAPYAPCTPRFPRIKPCPDPP